MKKWNSVLKTLKGYKSYLDRQVNKSVIVTSSRAHVFLKARMN